LVGLASAPRFALTHLENASISAGTAGRTRSAGFITPVSSLCAIFDAISLSCSSLSDSEETGDQKEKSEDEESH